MIDVGIIQGSKEQAKPLIVGTDTVYVHYDIEKVETEDNSDIYRYHEIQYNKDEYIKLMSEEITDTQQLLTDMDIHQLETEQLLTDMDIRIMGLEE